MPRENQALLSEGMVQENLPKRERENGDEKPGRNRGQLCVPQVTGMSCYVKAKENVSASVEIFKAIPSPPFPAPAELRPINSNLWTLFSVNMSFKTLNEPCSIRARRPRRSGSFEGRFRKAKSSMWLRHSPSPFVGFCFPSLGDKALY